MKRLVSLDDVPAYIDRYVGIRDSKHLETRRRLLQVHTHVVSQYQAYEEAVADGRLHEVAESADCARRAAELCSCYSGTTKALQELKVSIKGAQVAGRLKYCPMCAVTLPDTFDHYCPSSRFPEFSVHALNLVPCCAHCNSTKDNDWLDHDGRRRYLHLFVDDVPDLEYVRVTLVEGRGARGVGAVFRLARPVGIGNGAWALVASHFSRLHLIERYNEQANDEIGEILDSCRAFMDGGGSRIRTFLRSQARRRAEIFGRGYWRALLMTEMAAHANLARWIDAAL
jgi:5-methylcytosine-specific restriction endonuclease McrA